MEILQSTYQNKSKNEKAKERAMKQMGETI